MTGTLAYPEPWLLAWADVLHQAPGDDPMPRIDVIAVRKHRRLYGKYDPRRHVVTVYADNDRAESLATLVHEVAHAFTPGGGPKHGKVWRAKFLELTTWLTGLAAARPYEEVAASISEESRRMMFGTPRICDRVLQGVADHALTFQLRDALRDGRLAIEIVNHPTTGERCVHARAIDREHWVEVHHA